MFFYLIYDKEKDGYVFRKGEVTQDPLSPIRFEKPEQAYQFIKFNHLENIEVHVYEVKLKGILD